MPRKLSRLPRLLLTIGGALCALVAMPGAALAAECPVQTTTQAFAQFGDTNQYYLAPGGAFETLSWSKIGSVELSTQDDPFGLAAGSYSVRLERSEAVRSMPICVDRTMPHLRFVGQGSGQLDVEVRVTYDGSTNSSSGSVSDSAHRAWAPSRFVSLNTDAIPAGESATATITFRSQGGWRVDNVFIDPYRR
jgi:hypothetical protein